MSNMLDYIEQNPHETQRLLGLSYNQLKQLCQKAIALHHHKQQIAEANKIRKIKPGGGRKPKLSLEEQIILTSPLFNSLVSNSVSVKLLPMIFLIIGALS